LSCITGHPIATELGRSEKNSLCHSFLKEFPGNTPAGGKSESRTLRTFLLSWYSTVKNVHEQLLVFLQNAETAL